ncbi:hypothetical protein [Aeoliella sp. SH292]|uniref:hypothetical protein n=1 Tax=Aeoliella sp. SH292 TaxID=3454464 RepID=UPI003F983F29
MSTNISSENQNFIQFLVSTGQFHSVDEAVNEAVAQMRINQESGRGELSESLALDDWNSRFDAWVASHSDIQTVADDDRESIYAGRGE